MVVGQDDKGYEQFDWWRVKVWMLGLHIVGQWLKHNGLQKCLHNNIFREF
jgi:hypothetical protein